MGLDAQSNVLRSSQKYIVKPNYTISFNSGSKIFGKRKRERKKEYIERLYKNLYSSS